MSAAPVLSTALACRVEILNGPHAGQIFSCRQPLIRIGRGSDNDVVLENDPKVSRHHVEIKFENGQVMVSNVSEKNHVILRGKKISTKAMNWGDKIQLGNTELTLKLDAPASEENKTVVAMPNRNVAMPPPMMPPGPAPAPAPAPFPAAPPPPPPMGGAGRQSYSRPRPMNNSGSNRTRFYSIVIIVGLGLYWFFSTDTQKAKVDPVIGPPPSIQQEILKADETRRQLEEQKNRSQSLQARRAQENFIKGFRDFRQGQYARAREAFQVVLTLDPSHEEARRYLTLAKLKFDEQVKQNLQKGRVYYENKNYRLCKSSFLTVLTMLSQNPNDPSYQEAKKLYDICDLSEGGM